MLFSHPAVQAITWWDFSDFRAWQGAPAGLLRRDMTPKPAYEELLRLIKGKWWTRSVLHSSAEGSASFRGFLGDYEVSVAAPGRPTARAEFTLQPGRDNRWTVTLK